MKTHDDTRRISNMYGSQHATKRIYHRAQRRAAAAVIRSETQGYTAIFQTRYEVQARRVLGSLTFRGERLQFLFKDGWFAVEMSPNTVNCLNCGKAIDYRAGTCPHCGYVEFTERRTPCPTR